MKCALVWRNGFPELRVISSNDSEREYLEAHIGKNVEIEIRPTPPDAIAFRVPVVKMTACTNGIAP